MSKMLTSMAASTATGIAAEQVPLPSQPFPLHSLADLLTSRHSRTNLKRVLETSQWSVDAEMVSDVDKMVLKGGEEVAIICPVSGG